MFSRFFENFLDILPFSCIVLFMYYCLCILPVDLDYESLRFFSEFLSE